MREHGRMVLLRTQIRSTFLSANVGLFLHICLPNQVFATEKSCFPTCFSSMYIFSITIESDIFAKFNAICMAKINFTKRSKAVVVFVKTKYRTEN